MKRKITCFIFFAVAVVCSFSFKDDTNLPTPYMSKYVQDINAFGAAQKDLIQTITEANLQSADDIDLIQKHIANARLEMKGSDFWMRYLEPLDYKKVNGPLPVEWETEVFEKFEKPYKRECAGLTLAALYLEEEAPQKDSLLALVNATLRSIDVYTADSITQRMASHDHFYLCNRLFLLNLASIYTTGFECPDPSLVIPELGSMMQDVAATYTAFNEQYPNTQLPEEYLSLYIKAIAFVKMQPSDNTQFDHFAFIKQYINPLYLQNQKLINKYKVVSRNLLDYALTKNEVPIFNKTLYNGQDPRGIFMRVRDKESLEEIDRLGKLLFYDPMLSGNNMRSCASCHKPTEFFTDTAVATNFQFNHKDMLPRNTPSLINAQYNHLLMADGKHYTMQHQAKFVIANSSEMNCSEAEVLRKVLSCDDYKKSFTKLLQYTPQEPQISMEHIASALTYYYSKFSKDYAPFDAGMNDDAYLDVSVKQGFNLFMSKAQCATCHFVPQFNGVKPPYIGSEFEVLGVPKDTAYSALNNDDGRYAVNPAHETLNAFRTGTIRNAAYTKPYMHNGVFTTLEQVIEFYNTGGGAGHGLAVGNQTLSADSLQLTAPEKKELLAFIGSLNEKITFEEPPVKLPKSRIKALNARKPGGTY